MENRFVNYIIVTNMCLSILITLFYIIHVVFCRTNVVVSCLDLHKVKYIVTIMMTNENYALAVIHVRSLLMLDLISDLNVNPD